VTIIAFSWFVAWGASFDSAGAGHRDGSDCLRLAVAHLWHDRMHDPIASPGPPGKHPVDRTFLALAGPADRVGPPPPHALRLPGGAVRGRPVAGPSTPTRSRTPWPLIHCSRARYPAGDVGNSRSPSWRPHVVEDGGVMRVAVGVHAPSDEDRRCCHAGHALPLPCAGSGRARCGRDRWTGQ
jgi:hypothetical protein